MNQNPIIKALQAELEKSKAVDFKAECDKSNRCCESCYHKCLNSEIYFMYGHEAASSRLLSIVEELYTALSVSNEVLLWCEEMLKARDEINSKVHCAPVKLSPITERVIKAREFLITLAGEMNKESNSGK